MTKRADSLHQLHDMTAEELATHLKETRRKLFEVRFQQATGQVPNHRQVRELRREIARTLTIQLSASRAAQHGAQS